MADRVVLALEKLYDDVVARFVAEETTCEFDFGWRTPAEQSNVVNRIVWVPGDEAGNVGATGSAKYPGRTPARPIATILERFYVVISSHDPSDPENERKQYATTRLLSDAWERACYLAAHGTFKIESRRWIQTKNERRLGAALRIICTVEAMVPDEPYTAVTLDTDDATAVIDMSDDTAVIETLIVSGDET